MILIVLSRRPVQYAILSDATSQTKTHRRKKPNHVRKTSITCTPTILLLFLLLHTASAVTSDNEDGSGLTAAAAATVAAAAAGVAVLNFNDEGEQEELPGVTPPTLRGHEGEEEVVLPLPNDTSKYNYTRLEVIEMSITHTKQAVIKAIVQWGKDMKARFDCGSKEQKFGPGSTKLKAYFPNTQRDPYPDDVVDDLLRGLEPGSEAWRDRVKWIVSCGCHKPDKAGIYTRHSVPHLIEGDEDRDTNSQRQSPSVTPPTLRGHEGEEEVVLPLPNDTSKYNYTRLEVIEMSITHTKQAVIKAIMQWRTDMKARFGCDSKEQKFGPGSTKLKTYFPKTQSDPYPDDVVDDLLRNFEPGSDGWRSRVDFIVSCGCHKPDKAGIYSRHSVPHLIEGDEDRETTSDNEDGETTSIQTGAPCVTPESSDTTTPGGSTAQAFTFSQSQQSVPTPANRANSKRSTFPNGNQWTPEEEAFAEVLIREFNDGIIPITPGTMITDFLMTTLHCSRNRISKKYGSVIGIKQTKPFERDPSWMILSYSDMAAKVTALQDSEESFLKSKFDYHQKQRPGSIFGSIPRFPERNGTFHDLMLVNLVDGMSPFAFLLLSFDLFIVSQLHSPPSLSLANHEFCSVIPNADMGLVGNLKRWPLIWSVLADYEKNVSDRNEVVATMPSRIETDEEEEGTTFLNNFDCLKYQANSLDFAARPRKTRDGKRTIKVHNRILPDEDLRFHLIYLTCRVMRETGLDSSMETDVEELVAKILFYDLGYKSVKGSDMETWRKRLDLAYLNGLTEDDKPLQGKYKGRVGLADTIETSNPGMMRKLFFKAVEQMTVQASFKELAKAMTEIAATDEMGNNEWKFSAYIVRVWFKKNGGKLKSSKAKPFLTEDQKQARMEWCEEQKKKIESVVRALEAEAIANERHSDEEESESEVDEEGPDSSNLDETYIACAAGRHCCMRGASLPPPSQCHTCFNCNCDMHDICGEVWEDFLESGFEIRENSLSEEGSRYLDEEREEGERISICLKCCEKLTIKKYTADGREFYAVYLDEKWFYICSGRRKMKMLPLLPGETPPPTPKSISRRNALKVMFLGVVANPIPKRDFDGKIYLRRISETTKYKRATCNQNFSDYAPVNEALKNGDWKQYVEEDMKLQTLRTILQEKYDLDDSITERLVIQHKTPTGRDGQDRLVYIDAETDTVPSGDSLAMNGYTLKVQYKKGEEREVDVTCDSKFMLEVMHDVGRAIRDAYYWVSIYWPIFLYIDNAGGHGTKEAVTTYVNFLRTEYNVICVHQRPRSPETNMLDLGAWMALQSVVEKMHARRRYHANALANTVRLAWEALEPAKLSAIYKRWVKVLDLIILDKGGNDLVESQRGKLFSVPTCEEGNEQAQGMVTEDEEDGATEGMTTEQDEFFEEEIETDDLHNGCCAGQYCEMPGCPIAATHTCLNCGLHVHGICLKEWDQLTGINKSSLTKEGQQYLEEKHPMNDICLQCVELLNGK